MARIVIGIGSNVKPEENLRSCAELLRELFPEIVFSSVYETAPVGPADQPAFLNAVARFESKESAAAIAEKLRGIERKLKKNLPYPQGPRTIDLDLLLYGNEHIETSDLTIPHPRMHERKFVLEPLCDVIDPQERHPVLQRTWQELLGEMKGQVVNRIDNIERSAGSRTRAAG